MQAVSEIFAKVDIKSPVAQGAEPRSHPINSSGLQRSLKTEHAPPRDRSIANDQRSVSRISWILQPVCGWTPTSPKTATMSFATHLSFQDYSRVSSGRTLEHDPEKWIMLQQGL